MIKISAKNLAKKFQREWIFRNLNLTLNPNQVYTIIGPNGSGKSTLLKVLSGVMPSTKGQIFYEQDAQAISPDVIFRYLVIVAPYLELIEEFELQELVRFHTRFKTLQNQMSTSDFMQTIGLYHARRKLIKYFSSGMKQRLKLGLAFYSDTPIMMLDEPTSNLDQQAVAWYHTEIERNLGKRLIILCSNQPDEYRFCDQFIDITQFK